MVKKVVAYSVLFISGLLPRIAILLFLVALACLCLLLVIVTLSPMALERIIRLLGTFIQACYRRTGTDHCCCRCHSQCKCQ